MIIKINRRKGVVTFDLAPDEFTPEEAEVLLQSVAYLVHLPMNDAVCHAMIHLVGHTLERICQERTYAHPFPKVDLHVEYF